MVVFIHQAQAAQVVQVVAVMVVAMLLLVLMEQQILVEAVEDQVKVIQVVMAVQA